jgi:hypothetical protein
VQSRWWKLVGESGGTGSIVEAGDEFELRNFQDWMKVMSAWFGFSRGLVRPLMLNHNREKTQAL